MALPTDAVWLITGCSTGFGRALADELLKTEARVVATARDAAKVEDIARAHPDRALALPLDVTNAAQTRDALHRAEQKFGAIDVLVNNAGYGYMAAVEEGDDHDIRALFDTNVFGLVAVTRAVLPGMRARRRGHVVNLSSIGGLVAFPGSGFYCATKFAVEAISEALAQETAPLGIGVTVVEPGPFRTDFGGRSLKTARTAIDAYAPTAGARRQQLQSYSGKQPGDPVRAARAIIEAVNAPEPPLRLLLGAMAYETALRKLDELRENFTRWEKVARDADYPKEK